MINLASSKTRLALALIMTVFTACAERAPQPAQPALVMDGPPLALYGEYCGMRLHGSMDRASMAGLGSLALKAEKGNLNCEADINYLPNNKGRVRGLLLCTDGRRIPFTLRNLGPDQGLGLARESERGELMIFFYHPSAEEAERRYPQVKQDIELARAGQR